MVSLAFSASKMLCFLPTSLSVEILAIFGTEMVELYSFQLRGGQFDIQVFLGTMKKKQQEIKLDEYDLNVKTFKRNKKICLINLLYYQNSA